MQGVMKHETEEVANYAFLYRAYSYIAFLKDIMGNVLYTTLQTTSFISFTADIKSVQSL